MAEEEGEEVTEEEEVGEDSRSRTVEMSFPAPEATKRVGEMTRRENQLGLQVGAGRS